MRLKPEKIQQLAELIHDSLAANSQVKINRDRAAIAFEIGKIITEDLQTEDEIEAEARRLLEQHQDDLRRSGVRLDQAIWKAKQKIARDRGFVL
jgi:hypothetical protein